MGNETERTLRLDLINLDIEEIKVNRELYNLQLQINAKLSNEKRIKIKTNYKEFSERKLKSLEEKKRLLLENENNNLNNKPRNKMLILPEISKEENNNKEDNKLSLISNSSKGSQKNNNNIIDKIVTNNANNDNQDENLKNKEEIISHSESESKIKVKTIYTRKKSKKLKNIENEKEENINNNEEDMKNNDNNNDNNRYDVEKDKNNINEDLDENLNINEYKRIFFDKLSSLCPRSNINKSMDNKNSSIVEELEVVGLSQNDVLKDKLSDFFVGTSVASSSNQNKNNSSMHNNYYKNRPKSEISGINQELINGNKIIGEQNNEEMINSGNYQNQIYINEGDSEELIDKESDKKIGLGTNREKCDTEETINNKETGNNTDEKDKEKQNGIIVNERKLLKNHRNKAFINLENSLSEDDSEDL